MNMKGLKDNKALAQLDAQALAKELKTAQEELYVLKMKQIANELKETHKLKAHRAYIARIKTYLNAN